MKIEWRRSKRSIVMRKMIGVASQPRDSERYSLAR